MQNSITKYRLRQQEELSFAQDKIVTCFEEIKLRRDKEIEQYIYNIAIFSDSRNSSKTFCWTWSKPISKSSTSFRSSVNSYYYFAYESVIKQIKASANFRSMYVDTKEWALFNTLMISTLAQSPIKAFARFIYIVLKLLEVLQVYAVFQPPVLEELLVPVR